MFPERLDPIKEKETTELSFFLFRKREKK